MNSGREPNELPIELIANSPTYNNIAFSIVFEAIIEKVKFTQLLTSRDLAKRDHWETNDRQAHSPKPITKDIQAKFNTKLNHLLAEKIDEVEAKSVHLFVGSIDRQDVEADRIKGMSYTTPASQDTPAMRVPGTGSCFPVYVDLHEILQETYPHTPVEFQQLLLADTHHDLLPGTTMQRILAGKNSAKNYVWDISGINLLYAQMQELAIKNPCDNFVFHHIDMDPDKLTKIKKFFEVNSDLIPNNIKLVLNQFKVTTKEEQHPEDAHPQTYVHHELEQHASITGTGSINYVYQASLNYMKVAGYESPPKVRHQIDMTDKGFDLARFKTDIGFLRLTEIVKHNVRYEFRDTLQLANKISPDIYKSVKCLVDELDTKYRTLPIHEQVSFWKNKVRPLIPHTNILLENIGPTSSLDRDQKLDFVKAYENNIKGSSNSSCSIATVIGAVIGSVVGFVLGVVGGAIIGAGLGALTGPGAIVTAVVGAFVGAKAGVATGAIVGTTIIGSSIVGLGAGAKVGRMFAGNHPFFKEFSQITKATRESIRARTELVPNADDRPNSSLLSSRP